MSDPVTHVEIEDVLSSIRRLVSDEARVAPKRLETPLLGRLVLTPAQRVPDEVLSKEKVTPFRPGASVAPAAQQLREHDSPQSDLKQAKPAVGQRALLLGAVKPTGGAPATEGRSLESKIAELEAMFAQGGTTWDPTTEADALPAATASAESDPSAAPKQQPAVTQSRPDTSTSLDLAEDDSALRELVADIVRKELQGVLGEQITRNVRKLVRREINRALLSQDID